MAKIQKIIDSAPKNLSIVDSLLKAHSVLGRHRRISVSVSGGSDSDSILDLVELVKPEGCEVAYVFFDTGLEYDSTKRHLDYLEAKYGIKIERRRAKTTVAAACRLYGVPFISKDVSDAIGRLQTHGFDWSDTPEIATPEKYGRCKGALDWYFDRSGDGTSGKTRYSIKRLFQLKEFIISTPPTFKISEKCCDYAKKKVADEFHNEFAPDLVVTGMRIAHYKARLPLLLTPTDADNASDVAATDECLRRLSPAQADAVINLCTVFGLQFNSLLEVIENTIKMKERLDND